jgi:hypothetical protein
MPDLFVLDRVKFLAELFHPLSVVQTHKCAGHTSDDSEEGALLKWTVRFGK